MTYPKSNLDLDRRVRIMDIMREGHSSEVERLLDVMDDIYAQLVTMDFPDALSELPVIWQDGYFVPATRREAEGYLGRERKKAVSILQRVRSVEAHLRTQGERVWIQEKLEV